uniref:Ethanolamine-phosphate cytidylyltransferase n=1 Tax=Zeugodacus cucurbitae TaxID=28588 RepID=A0A0A1XM59_ZEUCU
MAPKAQFTLEELTKIALGAPELTSTSVHVLHSLINTILKKLDCQNDIVSISGVESDCLAGLLHKSKSAPITMDDKQISIIGPKLYAITEMERSIDEVKSKLDNHIQTARKFGHLSQMKYDLKDWENFKANADSTCIPCVEENTFACFMIGNIDFLKKLQRRIAEPMVLNLFEFEQEIKHLSEDMNELIANASANLEKLALIEGALRAVEDLKDQIEQHNLRFLGTMEEVQDILDFKLDKLQIPALKRYITINLHRVEARIALIQNKVDCPKPPGIISSGLRCLSCGDRQVCAEKGVHRMSMLPDAHAVMTARLPKVCKCTKKSINLAENRRQSVLNPNVIPEQIKKMKAASEVPTASVYIDDCKAICIENFSLFEGTDGNLYRKG